MSTQNINPSVVDRPLVMCGPSGTGKSTLLTTLFKNHPGAFGFSISHTTRSPRPGETNGKEYHFVSKEEFMERVGKGEFLEWAQFGDVNGRFGENAMLTGSYGTTFAALSALHPKRCILDIELQGVLQLREKAPLQTPPLNPVFLFLAPPSLGELKSRLSGRGTETQESIKKRLDAAYKEITYALKGEHDIVIVNDDVERAGGLLEKVATGKEGWEGCGDALPKFDKEELEGLRGDS